MDAVVSRVSLRKLVQTKSSKIGEAFCISPPFVKAATFAEFIIYFYTQIIVFHVVFYKNKVQISTKERNCEGSIFGVFSYGYNVI